MEFVGEAVKDHMLTTGDSEQKVVALGIATWGIIDNRDSLMAEDVSYMGPAPVIYIAEWAQHAEKTWIHVFSTGFHVFSTCCAHWHAVIP